MSIDKGKKEENIYTSKDVELHVKRDDCWIIIGGKVYDVTFFLHEHPGGAGIIFAYAGKDCTNMFEDIGHSHTATRMLDMYKIGVLVDKPIENKLK